MATPIIGLRIAGTKQRQAGFAPLVNIGVLAGGEGDNMDRVTLVAEKPAYIIKHAADYLLYQLIDRQVKSFDADAPGVLSIALTIPSSMQLANGASPYQLLREIYEKFLSTYMERLSDGRHCFINADNDSEVFRSILARYPMEERKSSYVRMNPKGLTGIVCVPPAELGDFFKNTQYKEFSNFKDIEVGVNCHSQVTPGLDRLQIPLPPAVYEVLVNGKRVGKLMQSPTDSYMASAEDSKEYTYESVEFTLGELLAAPSNSIIKNGANISLDSQNNYIRCELNKKDIYYTFVYEWVDHVGDNAKNKILSFVKNEKLKFYLGQENASDTLLDSTRNIKASNINGRIITVDSQTIGIFSLNVLSSVNDAKRQIVTKIIINKKAIGTQQNMGRTLQSHDITKPINDFQGDTPQKPVVPEPRPNKMIDIKSFLFGVVIGLLIGVLLWFVIPSSSAKEDNPLPDDNIENINPVDDVADQNALLDNPEPSINDEVGEGENVVSPEVDKDEEEAKKQQAADAKAKAEAKAEADAQAKIDKASLIQFVSEIPSLEEYKKHPGYKVLSNSERTAIESFLNPDQFKDSLNTTALKNLKRQIKQSSYSFKTMDDVRKVQYEIIKFLNDPNNKK